MRKDIDAYSIVAIAGGPAAVAQASKETAKPVNVNVVQKWRRTGIPERHWELIVKLCDGRVGIDTIYAANQDIRKRKGASH